MSAISKAFTFVLWLNWRKKMPLAVEYQETFVGKKTQKKNEQNIWSLGYLYRSMLKI